MPRPTRAELTARRRRLLREAHVRRRTGRAMLAVAATGVITAVVGTAVAWRLVSDVDQATSGSLDVTIETLDSLEDTFELADGVLGSTTSSLEAVEANLEAIDASFSTGSVVVGDASELTGAAEPALRNVTGTLRQLAALGAQIDGLLTSLASLPLAPDYDPDNGLGTTFDQLADDLEPLPDQFGDTSESLAEFETSLTALQVEVGELARSVGEVNDGLDGSQQLLADYRANVEQARTVAVASRDNLTRDQTILRLVILVAGLNFIAVQLVPLWLGWQLLDEEEQALADAGLVPAGDV